MSDEFGMSAYEQQRWHELQAYWEARANRRPVLPQNVRKSLAKATDATSRAFQRANESIPQGLKEAAATVADKTLAPTVQSVVHLLEFLNDWIIELNDPKSVLSFHQKRGHEVASVEQILSLDMEEAESLTRAMTLKWRAIGAAEGGAAGALALIPVPLAGSAAAISVDIVAMQALATALATRTCYTYGFEPNTDSGREMITRMVRSAYYSQVGKTGTFQTTSNAFRASAGRSNWSAKLRNDHRILEALEKLMKTSTGAQHVPVKSVRMGLPAVSMFIGSGANAFALGNIAKGAQKYGATRFLTEKYGLPLPKNLNTSAPFPDYTTETNESDVDD